MVRKTLKLSIFPAAGGLHSANNPALIDIHNLADMNNIMFTNDASRKTRPGLNLIGTLPDSSNIQYIKDFWRLGISGSQANKIVAVAGGKVYADSGGDGIFVDKTGALVIPSTDTVTMDVFAGLLIICFQSVNVQSYNHTGNISDLGGSPPIASLCRTHSGYFWLSGIQGFPHTVRRSLAGNPEVWSGLGTDSFTINDGDGDPVGITALFPSFYGDLYVAKRRSIYRIRETGSLGTFGVSSAINGVGCISHNGVVSLQNDIIFPSERGIHSLSATDKYGDAESQFLSAPIHDIYNNELDFTRANEIQAAYVPEFNSYIMTFPRKGASFNTDLLGLNIVTGQWYRFKNINAQVVNTFINSSRKSQLILANNDGQVATLDSSKKVDFGTIAIESSFKTGVIYPLGIDTVSKFESLTCIYRPQGISEFTVATAIDGQSVQSLSFDQSSGTFDLLGPNWILGSAKLGSRGQVKVETKSLTGQGRGIELTFNRNPSGSNLNQGMEVLGYILEVSNARDSGTSTVQ